MAMSDDARVEAELKGSTLLVYWYAIRKGSHPIGVREVQRALHFSSPSVASHHLEKLRQLGLLERSDDGGYLLKEEVKVGFLKYFLRVGKFMLPRHLFYAVFFTTILIGYLALYPKTFTADQVFALLSLSLASLIFWYETAKTLREVPF